MLIKQTEEMSLPERLAAENTNNQYLQALSYVAVGTIFPYAGEEAPDTYLMCDGAALDITEYSELFNVIGYAFGGENETFNLPDLRGRVIVGINADDEDFVGIGKKGGDKTHTLSEDEMPKHRHKIYHPNNAEGSTESALANTGFPTPSGIKSTFKATMCEVTDSGGNQAHNNLQPYIVVNYIIKAKQAIEKTDFRFPIDKVYSPKSLNAQSGLALDPIFSNKQDKFAAFTQTSKDEYTLDLSAVTGKNRVIVKYSDSEYLAFRQGAVEIAGVKVNLNPLAGEVSMSACRVSEVETPQKDTDAANKKYVDEHSGSSWKNLSSGALDDTTGGVAAISAELTEDISQMRELNLYLEFVATTEMDGKTAYLNANISGSTLSNCIYTTTSDVIKGGTGYKSISHISIIKAFNGYMVQGVHSKMSANMGINSRGNAVGSMSPWNIDEGATQHLNINISSTTFPSGTKWVLEGR